MRVQLKLCPRSRANGLRLGRPSEEYSRTSSEDDRRRRPCSRGVGHIFGFALGLAASGLLLAATPAQAQVVDVSTSHGIFHEQPSAGNFSGRMTVYTPAVRLKAMPWEWLDVRGGYTADVVSGASVATKAGSAYQATHPGADVVSGASLSDTRHVGSGGLTLRKDNVTLDAGYSYSTEHDYRSHGLTVTARTEPYDRNTQLELGYARNWDTVCDRAQSPFDPFVRHRALEDSKGCFTSDALRAARPLDVDTLSGGWTQAWTPTFLSQLVYTAELVHGFQSNPYRSVILGEGLKAQEHQPENRARHAVALRGHLYLRPLRAALKLGVRGYWDTWDILSGTVELEIERTFGEGLRLALRGRAYRQSGALFWSDDYTGGDRPLGPKGQYWTGDRDLSPFTSFLGGLRANTAVNPKKGRILGLMMSLRVGGSFDVVAYSYDEYTLGGQRLQNARALLGSLTAGATF